MKVNKKVHVLVLIIIIANCLDCFSNTIEVPAREHGKKRKVFSDTRNALNITEHKTNGRIDSIEIRPAVGRPYYLIDNDDTLRQGIKQSREQKTVLSNWRLLQW